VFDIGFWEIAIIGVIALLILGPERLPRAARTAGLWVGKARRTLADVKRDIDRELDASELKKISNIKNEIKEDLKEATDAVKETATSLNEKIEETEQSFSSQAETESKQDKPRKDKLSEQAAEASAPEHKEQTDSSVSEPKTAT